MIKNQNPYLPGTDRAAVFEHIHAGGSPFANLVSSVSNPSPQAQSDWDVWNEMVETEKKLTRLRAECVRRCKAIYGHSSGIFAGNSFVPRASSEKWVDAAEAKYRACKKKLDALEEPARRAEVETERAQTAANRILAADRRARGIDAPTPWIAPVQPPQPHENTPREVAAIAARVIAADKKRRGLSD
jgi:hypothetical protein